MANKHHATNMYKLVPVNAMNFLKKFDQTSFHGKFVQRIFWSFDFVDKTVGGSTNNTVKQKIYINLEG